jgi:hypothetical protein
VTQQPHYTDEVRAALRQQAALRGDDPQPAPDGQIRYHIAVEQTLLNGTAPPLTVAATLRGLADQLDPPNKETA